MPVAPTYPGVYIEEIPSGVRTITGVATSIGAFVGTFRKGPLNEAMQIFSMADFQREYGGLVRSSEASYAVQQFFLNGGTQAWIVRVADTVTGAGEMSPTNANSASVVLENASGQDIFRATTGRRLRGESAADPGVWGNNLRLEVDYDTADPARLFNLTVSEVRREGERTITVQTETFRNLTMEPDTPNNALEVVNQGSRLVQLDRVGLTPAGIPDPFEPDFRPTANGTISGQPVTPLPTAIAAMAVTLTTAGPATAIGPIALTLGAVVPTTHREWAQELERALHDAAVDPALPLAHRPYLAGATVAIVTSTTAAGAIAFSAQPADNSTITINGAVFTFLNAPVGPNDIQIDSVDLTTTLANAAAALNGSPDPVVAPASYSAGADTITVVHNTPGTVGIGFTLAADPLSFGTVSAGTLVPAPASQFVVRTGQAARPFSPAAQLTFSGPLAADLLLAGGAETVADQLFALEEGREGQVLDAAGNFLVPVGMFQGTLADKTGIYALEDVDLFNILCIPQAALLAAADMRALYTEAESYVEDRRAMLIVDIPPDVRLLEQAQTWLSQNESLRHRNAAVYYPRLDVADPLNLNRPQSLASSGTIAGLWARTDVERGVWKAPAGTDARLRNVESLSYLLTDAQNGALNPLGVNCLRSFPIYAHVCWGSRTLEGADVIASDWKYVPVRRTALYIEESLYRGTKWVVFEPNDEPLWAQIRLNVGAFMQDLFRKGAFQGTTPRDAYFVKCDGETTTQDDIDHGIVNIEVGFAPLKPAEFVIIKIQQIVNRPEV